MKDKVTCIITTYGNFDFTAATVWALRRFYPELRIILADGGSNEETIRRMQDLCLIGRSGCRPEFGSDLGVGFVVALTALTAAVRRAASVWTHRSL